METPLLNAVLDNPEDMPARLVYADWLEERGDPLAEFIRVQIAISEIDWRAEQGGRRRQSLNAGLAPPARANKQTAPTAERINLARRAVELLSRYRRRWNGQIHRKLVGTPLCNKVGRRQSIRRWDYSRGFVEFLRAADSVILNHGDLLLRIAPFRRLHITCATDCFRDLTSLRIFSQASDVTLCLRFACDWGQLHDIEQMCNIEGLPRVRIYDFSGQALTTNAQDGNAQDGEEQMRVQGDARTLQSEAPAPRLENNRPAIGGEAITQPGRNPPESREERHGDNTESDVRRRRQPWWKFW